MPAKVPMYWEDRVNSIKGEHENWGAGRIRKELKQEAQEIGRGDYPSERWVGKYLKDEWTEEKRKAYSLVSWPHSMGGPDLPWEASSAILELLAYMNDFQNHERPSHQTARWFWRVTQAAPDAPLAFRFHLAIVLATRPLMGYSLPRFLEGALANAGRYRQTNQGGHVFPMEELEQLAVEWLGFADIEGTGPDPVIRIVRGEQAAELIRRRGHGEEQTNE